MSRTRTLCAVLGAAAAAAKDIWAVAGQTGYLVHFNGSAWSVAKTFTSGLSATGVTAFSPTNVWVFGRTGFGPGLGTWHLHGTTWTQVTGLGGSVTKASALSASDIWAIGSKVNPQDAIVRYQGSGRQRVTSAALSSAQFNNILAASDGRGGLWMTAEAQASTNKSWVVHLAVSSTGAQTWTRHEVTARPSRSGRTAPSGRPVHRELPLARRWRRNVSLT
jgi:hypothetical protein